MAHHPNAKFENYEKLDIIGIYYQCAFNSEQAAEEYLNRLGAMDSLHVTPSQQAANSKTSSRSTSPARHRAAERNTSQERSDKTFHPHHAKTLSHGSADSAKSYEGHTSLSRPSRHKSPTQLTKSHALDHPSLQDSSVLDDTSALLGNISQDPDVSDLYPSSFISNGSGETKEDETDCGAMDSKTNAVLEHLGSKIVRVRDLIRTEQKLRDDNVNEYLKLAANADKQQVQRIKAVFEKKNQKSAQVIAQLQKKLDVYQKRVHDLEKGIQSHRPPREVLRDMGQGLKNVGGNIRDGITGFSGSVMSKPREFAHLIKNKFGSADNISQLSTWYVGPAANQTTGSEGSCADKHQSPQTQHQEGGQTGEEAVGHQKGGAKHGGSATLPMTASQSSMQGRTAQRKFPSDDGSECESSVTSDSIGRYGRPQKMNLKDTFIELDAKMKYFQEQLDGFRESLESIKSFHTEIQLNNLAMQEERFRTERLEEQINDLTELHQNEVENLKQAMADMEEKVQYQSEERLRDIHEMLEHCQTKIQKMEHQALQQQQYVTLEGLDNSNARALVVKLINVLLTVLQVVLLLVATGAGIIMPFLRTRVRIITTVVCVIAIVFTLKQWPEVRDIGGHVMKRLKDTLDPVQ